MLHPITHEVYELDGDDISHNFEHCIEMDFLEFEKLANTGSCSAERLIDFANKKLGVFHFSQVMFVKISTNPVRYAWASRIKVRLDNSTLFLGLAQHMGSEFIWVWPASAAINAFVTYKERNRLTMASTTMLDIFEPSISHASATPGTQLGPSDFENTKSVPFSELSMVQRFFISCIKPQRTQFQRRRVTDRWPQHMKRSDIGARNVFNKNDPGTQMLARQRELEFWCTPEPPAKMRALSSNDWWLTNKTDDTYSGMDFMELPEELNMRILCMSIATSLTETTRVASETICALRSVSKHFRDATDGFVGISLKNLRTSSRAMLENSASESPLAVGASVRALGLTPRLAIDLATRVHENLSAASAKLFPLNLQPSVPRWRDYLRARYFWDKNSSRDAALVASKQIPSKIYAEVSSTMASLHAMGHVDPNSNLRVCAHPEYDMAISRGSVASDLANALVECVGM